MIANFIYFFIINKPFLIPEFDVANEDEGRLIMVRNLQCFLLGNVLPDFPGHCLRMITL